MIGIISDDVINHIQYYHMFNCLNDIKESCYLFINRMIHLPVKNNFTILQKAEALHHPGILISTSIFNTQILANSILAEKKYFYLWNLELINLNFFTVIQALKNYYNQDIELIVRSESHYNIVQKLFKKPIGIVENWNKDQLLDIIGA